MSSDAFSKILLERRSRGRHASFATIINKKKKKGKGVDRITEPQRDEDENGWKREKKKKKENTS